MALHIKAVCSECRDELKVSVSKCYGNEDAVIAVEPCEDCLSKSYDEGKKDGEGN